MRIDCYGRKTEKTSFAGGPRVAPLETKTSGKWTFMRFGDGDRVASSSIGSNAGASTTRCAFASGFKTR